MAPENWWLEDVFPIGNAYFQGLFLLVSGSVNTFSKVWGFGRSSQYFLCCFEVLLIHVFLADDHFFLAQDRGMKRIDPSALCIPSAILEKATNMLGKTSMHGAGNCKTKTLYPKAPDSYLSVWSVDCTVHDDRMSFVSYFSELLHAYWMIWFLLYFKFRLESWIQDEVYIIVLKQG